MVAPIPTLLPEQPLPPPGEGRLANGRFASGNPGRAPGHRNRITLAMEALLEGQWQALTAKAIDMAMKGDSAALRLCIERLMPVRKGAAIEIPDFPRIETAADVPKAFAAILSAAAAGQITADDAAPLVTILAAFSNSLDTAVFAERLDALEKEIEGTRNGTK
jgi:hypothetical protein